MTTRKTTPGQKASKKKTVTAKPAIKKNTPKKKAAKKASKKTQKKTEPKTLPNKTMVLNPVLVINNAKSLSQDFTQLLQNNGDINIDASSVEMIDTAILQLLLAVTNKVKTSKHEVHWLNPSDIFISNVTLLGLSESLGLPQG
jgi:anti-anti-sigma regulatory factor